MHVWLVDDSEADLYLMRRSVSRACPAARITTFRCVADAISRWRQQSPDCLFLDLNLGVGSGLDLVDVIDGAPDRAPAINVVVSGVALPAESRERLRTACVRWQVCKKPMREQHVADVLAQAGFISPR
ncbi:MAG: response regulator [Pseudomonadota bacterium]